jgi:hypothetical protein
MTGDTSSVAQPASLSPIALLPQYPMPASAFSAPAMTHDMSSAAQPAVISPKAAPSQSGMPTTEVPAAAMTYDTSSAAQPEPSASKDRDDDDGNADDNASLASHLEIPRMSTPLYNELLEKLASTDDQLIMESLANLCLFGPLKDKAPAGSAEQPAFGHLTQPYSLSMRIENLLFKTKEQRELHIARLSARHDPRAQHGDTFIFNDEDMKEVLNAWRNQPEK